MKKIRMEMVWFDWAHRIQCTWTWHTIINWQHLLLTAGQYFDTNIFKIRRLFSVSLYHIKKWKYSIRNIRISLMLLPAAGRHLPPNLLHFWHNCHLKAASNLDRTTFYPQILLTAFKYTAMEKKVEAKVASTTSCISIRQMKLCIKLCNHNWMTLSWPLSYA